MYSANTRRTKIISLLEQSNSPISGTTLAQILLVSRQVIVQDIAILRAQNHTIVSTHKGYLYYKNEQASNNCIKQIHVSHTLEETLDEMYTILDFGGSMLDVFVEHDLYGTISADLVINTYTDADVFINNMKISTSKPLKVLTGETHWHTITAPSEKIMNLIIEDLSKKGLLVLDSLES